MATVSKWSPFGVSLDITATAATVTRKSATQYTVKINASWKTTWDTKTDYGMTASSGGSSVSLNTEGHKAESGSGSFTGTYSISGNGSATKTVTVTFKNYNTYHNDSATKTVSFTVTVPAWTSYTVSYNKNTTASVSNMPSSQTKWKDQSLTLSGNVPTRTGYSFLGWSASSSATSATYKQNSTFTTNANTTLYAIWKVNTWSVTYNANGGAGAPGSQTKEYGKTLVLSTKMPSRTDYTFLGWSTSASATTAQYKAGGNYTANAAATLYAVWELAYFKPQITAITVERGLYVSETGKWTPSDTGTMAELLFDVDTFLPLTSVKITVETAGKAVSTRTLEWSTEGQTKGESRSFEEYIGVDSPLNVDSTYTIKITARDTKDSTTATVTLAGAKFVIDFLAGGRGASIGKPAELEDVFDVGFQTKLTGGLRYPILEPCDLDIPELQIPNTYSGRNVSSYTYTYDGGRKPLPFTEGTFTLEVLSSGPNGQILQRLTVCDKYYSEVYERWYCTSAWSEWTGGWVSATLSQYFTIYGTDTNANCPKYRKDGRTVEIRGVVTPINDIPTGDDMYKIFDLPTGYRPSSPIYTICQGSGSRVWLLRINTNGAVEFSRYRDGDTRNVTTNGAWLPFQCTFLTG